MFSVACVIAIFRRSYLLSVEGICVLLLNMDDICEV